MDSGILQSTKSLTIMIWSESVNAHFFFFFFYQLCRPTHSLKNKYYNMHYLKYHLLKTSFLWAALVINQHTALVDYILIAYS